MGMSCKRGHLQETDGEDTEKGRIEDRQCFQSDIDEGGTVYYWHIHINLQIVEKERIYRWENGREEKKTERKVSLREWQR